MIIFLFRAVGFIPSGRSRQKVSSGRPAHTGYTTYAFRDAKRYSAKLFAGLKRDVRFYVAEQIFIVKDKYD